MADFGNAKHSQLRDATTQQVLLIDWMFENKDGVVVLRRGFVKGLFGLSALVPAYIALGKTGSSKAEPPVGAWNARLQDEIKNGVPYAVLRAKYGESSPQSMPLLVMIVTHGFLDQLKSALVAGADPNVASPLGHTPLKASLLLGSLAKAVLLLDSGAKVGVRGKHSELAAAVIGKSDECVDVVLTEGAAVIPKDLETALRIRSYRMAESLWRVEGSGKKIQAILEQALADRADLIAVTRGWIL